MSDKQIQKAGDNSQQIQAGTVIIQNGITEERARETFSEMTSVARKDYTEDAYGIALQRVAILEYLLMEQTKKVDGLLEAFGDPSFQFLLTNAQKKAAASERESDYELLTELLVCRAQKKNNRKFRAGISHAVDIVDEVDDDALYALTLCYLIGRLYPLSGNCLQGLDVLNSCFETLLNETLPEKQDWIEHLEILNTIRVLPYSMPRRFENIYAQALEGYVCVGIKKDSDNYNIACELLAKRKISRTFLENHPFLDGYVRLPITHINNLVDLRIQEGPTEEYRALTDEELICLHDVWGLYSKDEELLKSVKEKFIIELNKRPALKRLMEWRNTITTNFSITQAGIVLAHVNAQRLDNTIGDLTDL